jgi:rod shape-determining protein MreC
VYDKTVRRRRAVLVLLVVLSLLLLTAYFGEAPNGRLHAVQRGFLTVISPIQDGANKALKPVRDLFGWVDDTVHAKSQRDQLLKQVDKLRGELIADQSEKRSYHELQGIYHLDNQLSVNDYHPVTATVVGKSPNIWYATVVIDKGESAGVQVNDPVINGEGLVGKVAQVASDGAQVSLITDSTMGVSARIDTTAATGIVQPKVGDPNDLLLQYLPPNTEANPGEYVVTSGTVASPDDSLYPPGILIGQVTSVNEESAYKSVNVRPAANLHDLDVVQVLTAAQGTLPANLSRLAASLPVGQNAGASGVQGEQLASTGAGE